jgi:hypothetical protein
MCIPLTVTRQRLGKNVTAAENILQTDLLAFQKRLKKWRMKANETKSTHVTFTTRRATCPPVHINEVQLPQSDDVKYLGLHLDRRLSWHKHVFIKRKQLGLTFTKMYWLLGRQSQLSTSNKLLLYKTIFKPIWTYGIQLWGTAYISNIEILERSNRRPYSFTLWRRSVLPVRYELDCKYCYK